MTNEKVIKDWIRDCDLLIESGVATDHVTVCPIQLRGFLEELQQLRGNLSLAEEGLASAMQEIKRLRGALLDLYNGTAEYVYLNNLGDPHNTTPMRRASEVLGVAYPRSMKPAHEPEKKTMANQPLTLENIRTGAFLSDAHAVGFMLGEIERLSCNEKVYDSMIDAGNRELERLRQGIQKHIDGYEAYDCCDVQQMRDMLVGVADEPEKKL